MTLFAEKNEKIQQERTFTFYLKNKPKYSEIMKKIDGAFKCSLNPFLVVIPIKSE